MRWQTAVHHRTTAQSLSPHQKVAAPHVSAAASRSRLTQTITIRSALYSSTTDRTTPGEMTADSTPRASTDSGELVLQHVLVLHRHGDRSPVFDHSGANLYVGDEEKAFWMTQLATPEQLAEVDRIGAVVGETPDQVPSEPPIHGSVFPGGNLTSLGLDHMRQVGVELRERYSSFIRPDWSNDQVFVQSTNFFRTIQSAEALLSGLFPSASSDRPFLIRVRKFDTFSLALVKESNKTLEVKLEAALDEKFGPGGFAAIREQAYSALAADRSLPVPWTPARDIIECNLAHGVPLPETLSAAVVEALCRVDCFMWHELYSDMALCRQYFTPGIRDVFDNLCLASKQTNPHKLTIVSAHDSSIITMLNAMGVSQPSDSTPPFASRLCIETYIDPASNAAFVKLDLNGTTLGGDCGGLMPFSQVEGALKAFFAGTA